MARFPTGALTIKWAAWTPYNDFTITVDGGEVFSFQGAEFGWPAFVIPLSAGVHEISITHAAIQAPYGTVAIDAVTYTPDGLSFRPDNDSCIAPPVGNIGSEVDNISAFPEIPYPYFKLATKLLQPPGDASRWFVLETDGLVKVFDVADPTDVRTFLDISANVRQDALEAGLLGMAFDPDFPSVPEIYLTYVNNSNYTTISRFILDDTDAPVSPIEQVVLSLRKDKDVHYGGDIAFGPDDSLYMAFGDDQSSARSQDTTNLYGSMLRIDVREVTWPSPGYTIPAGNPFPATNPKCGPTPVNAADCPEIFAWGFRNPWRWSFDSLTGDLWLGDVGRGEWEEVDLVVAGGNYGWACLEGSSYPGLRPQDCVAGMIPPVAEYSHNGASHAITGGVVYRGTAMPERYGRYIFADLRGAIYELLPDGSGGYIMHEIAFGFGNLSAMVEGVDKEIYFINYASVDWNPGGWSPPAMQKLVPGEVDPDPPPPVIPDDLADTGCVDPADITQPATGLIPYGVNARLWSDGAFKTRYMALPNDTTIDINGADDWDFPVGTVLVKNFHLDGKIIETRLLMHRQDLEFGATRWEGFTYEWDDTETSATRVIGGKTKTIGDQDWPYPSSDQCDACHTQAAGKSLGLETAQLNGDFLYPLASSAVNQLEALNEIGMFTLPLSTTPDQLPRLADPSDNSESLHARARAYLHTNCAQCHRPGTGIPANMDLRYTTQFSDTNTCDIAPGLGDLGIGPSARLIAPGDAASSVIINRMSRRDADGMPPLGTNIVDSDGVQLLADWINSLGSCLPSMIGD